MLLTKRICIVIPAYNEGPVLGSVVNDIRRALSKRNINYEIVVVDDGSTDDTHDIAIKSKAKVIKHIVNSGAGRATATGLRYAQINDFDLAVTMDADGQHLSQDVLAGIENAFERETDLLIGSRLIDSDGMSRVKVLGNKGLTLITKLLFGIKTTDSQSGLRVFSKDALHKLKWRTSGYEFCSEMLWRANNLGLKIDEFPISAVYTEYSVSKGQNNWNAINIVKNLVSRRISELLG